MANQERVQQITPNDVEDMINVLGLPRERAERTQELGQKLQNGDISKAEFLEFATNFFVRKEQVVNPKVNNFGVMPYVAMAHLYEGDSPPKNPNPDERFHPYSINGLLQAQFETLENKEDVIEASQQAHEDGVIYVTSRRKVMFHAEDVSVDEDGFEPTPQVASEEETEEEEGTEVSAAEAAGF